MKLREMYLLLKTTNIESQAYSNFYLWYIDLNAKTLKIEFFNRNKTIIDPLNCIIGFVLPKPPVATGSQIHQKEVLVNNYLQGKSIKIDHQKKDPKHKHNASFTTGMKSVEYTIDTNHSNNNLNKSEMENKLNEDPRSGKPDKFRMSLQIEDLPYKAKQGIKIMSHRSKQKNDFVERIYQPGSTTHRYSNYKAVILGGNKGSETTRERKNISTFQVPFHY